MNVGNRVEMFIFRLIKQSFFLFLFIYDQSIAQSNLTVEIVGGGLKQHAISLLRFQNQHLLGEDFQQVIRNDLSMTGLFRYIDSDVELYEPSGISDTVSWISRGVMSVNMGGVRQLSDGYLEVKVSLLDLSQSKSYFSRAFNIHPSQSRQLAHLISDLIYESITGVKGVFSTKIIYVFKPAKPTAQTGRYQLQVADMDGANQQTILRSNQPIISPTWSWDGRRVAYVSFESRKAVVYLHDLGSGNRQIISNFKGSNSAPAFSPDGRWMIVTLSQNENSQLFLLNLDSLVSSPQKLITSNAIDTESTFSADGKYVYFTSDRSGSPQIYRFDFLSRNVERVTYDGNYNVTPSVSVRGDLAFIQRQGDNFKLMIQKMGSPASSYTKTREDESPSWSANGEMILFATEENGRSLLKIITVDGSTTTTLRTPAGQINAPEFSPYIE